MTAECKVPRPNRSADSKGAGAVATPASDDHFRHSSVRENILEHIFVAELLRHLWIDGIRDIDVMKAEVDASGFDLAIECRGILRHIQLKASHLSSKTSRVPINVALTRKSSGCIVWIHFDEQTLTPMSYHWFGGTPGHPLPDLGTRVGRHTRGSKRSRENIRIVGLAAFRELNSIQQVAAELFGDSLTPDLST